jgi:hypothetical protein
LLGKENNYCTYLFYLLNSNVLYDISKTDRSPLQRNTPFRSTFVFIPHCFHSTTSTRPSHTIVCTSMDTSNELSRQECDTITQGLCSLSEKEQAAGKQDPIPPPASTQQYTVVQHDLQMPFMLVLPDIKS